MRAAESPRRVAIRSCSRSMSSAISILASWAGRSRTGAGQDGHDGVARTRKWTRGATPSATQVSGRRRETPRHLPRPGRRNAAQDAADETARGRLQRETGRRRSQRSQLAGRVPDDDAFVAHVVVDGLGTCPEHGRGSDHRVLDFSQELPYTVVRARILAPARAPARKDTFGGVDRWSDIPPRTRLSTTTASRSIRSAFMSLLSTKGLAAESRRAIIGSRTLSR